MNIETVFNSVVFATCVCTLDLYEMTVFYFSGTVTLPNNFPHLSQVHGQVSPANLTTSTSVRNLEQHEEVMQHVVSTSETQQKTA